MKGELDPTKNRLLGGISCIWMAVSNLLICFSVWPEGGGGVLIIMHGRSPMTFEPRIPAGVSPTRQTSLALSAKRREVFGESHEG